MATNKPVNSVMLINGYIHHIEKMYTLSMNIAKGINNLIVIFFPNCIFYGIGNNSPHDQFALEAQYEKNNEKYVSTIGHQKWHYLSAMSSLCCHPQFLNCGDKNYFVRTLKNEIYAMGNNASGNCGVGTNEDVKQFTKLIFESKTTDLKDYTISIVSKGCYTKHQFVIFQNNKKANDQMIFSFGENELQQQGFKCDESYESSNISSPIINISFKGLFINTKIREISTGRHHSMFLCTNGRVYSCGDNADGQCGIGVTLNSNDNTIVKPQIVPLLYDIANICCGESHTLCIDEKNRVWVFGMNNQCQLGLGLQYETKRSVDNAIMNPTFNGSNDDNRIIFISCGDDFSLCISINGKAYLFGSNYYKQCAVFDNTGKSVSTPHCIQSDKQYKDIQFICGDCGHNHTVLISNYPQNNLYSVGDDSFNQTGNIDDNSSKSTKEAIYLIKRKEIGLDDNVEFVGVIGDDLTTVIACKI